MLLMRPRPRWLFLLLAAAAVLSGCAGVTPEPSNYNLPENRYAAGGSILGPGGLSGLLSGGQAKPQTATLGVNAYLWRATLDTLSFMPIASADPFGGVIITDWYSPPSTPDERFKADAYILGRELQADSIRLSLFRQVRRDRQWIDAPVDPSTVTAIEDRILARAGYLRTLSNGS